MPVCYLRTNMKRSELTGDAEEQMAMCIHDTFGVPIEFVFVMMPCELPAFMGGSRDSALVCEISAKKFLNNDDDVKKYFPKFFQKLKDITKLPGNRIVIHLIPVADNMADIGK